LPEQGLLRVDDPSLEFQILSDALTSRQSIAEHEMRLPNDPFRRIRRRRFLASAGSGLGLCALPSAPALARPVAPSEAIRIGIIGCGERGSQHLSDLLTREKMPGANLEVTGVCDIYEPRLESSHRQSHATAHRDYRELLDRKDVDAVVIATPDHWHARMCLDAIATGKDVYCEKPWTRTVEEAKACYHAAIKSDRICQIGSQHTALGAYWTAREAIAAGKIGQVVWSQSSYSRNSRGGEWNYPIDDECSERNLDWEAFLGSAPKTVFNREHFFRFRKYWAYSGGIATDLHYHKLAALLIALGGGFPLRVTSAGGTWVHRDEGHGSPREVPDTFFTCIDYAAKHSVVLASSMANRDALPDVIRGHKATLRFGSSVIIRPESDYLDDFRDENHGRTQLRLSPKPRDEHMSNFLACVRSRRSEGLNCGPLLGYQTMVAIGMSVEAYRQNKVLVWDPGLEVVKTA